MAQTVALAQSDYNLQLEPVEDPWIILTVLRCFLNKFSSAASILPVCTGSCSCSAVSNFAGDLEYIRDVSGPKVKLKNRNCAQCGQGMVVRPGFLPSEFFIKIGGNRRAGYFDDVYLPKFPNHRPSAYIQYHPQLKHFRLVKKLKDKLLIVDGLTSVFCDASKEDEVVNSQ